jgi:hypothetical protein
MAGAGARAEKIGFDASAGFSYVAASERSGTKSGGPRVRLNSNVGASRDGIACKALDGDDIGSH